MDFNAHYIVRKPKQNRISRRPVFVLASFQSRPSKSPNAKNAGRIYPNSILDSEVLLSPVSVLEKLRSPVQCRTLLVLFICLLIFSHVDTLPSLVLLATIILCFSFVSGHSAQVLSELVRPFILRMRRSRGIDRVNPLSLSLFSLQTYLTSETWS